MHTLSLSDRRGCVESGDESADPVTGEIDVGSVAVMAVFAPQAPSTEVSSETRTGWRAERRSILADAVALRVRLGYEVESRTEFSAVVFTPSPRRWLWMRRGSENSRLTVTVDDDCRVSMSKRRA